VLKTSESTPVAVLLLTILLLEREGSIVAASGVADQRAYSQTDVTLRRSDRRHEERKMP